MLCYSRGPGEVLSPEYLPWQSDTHRLISNTSSRDIMHGGGGGAGPGFGGLGPNEPKDPWEVKKRIIFVSVCVPVFPNYFKLS